MEDIDINNYFKYTEESIKPSKKIKPKHTIYQIMASSTNRKFFPTQDELDSMSTFFMLRYISNNEETIKIANQLNMLGSMSNRVQYLFVRYSNLKKVKYINTSKNDKEIRKLVDKICKIHDISRGLGLQYLKLYNSPKGLKYLEERYKIYLRRESKK